MFALWVDRVDAWAMRTALYGWPMSESSNNPCFTFRGEVVIVTPSGRDYRIVSLSSIHVGSVPKYAWTCEPPLDFSPPFLVTDDLATEMIYNGRIATFELAPRFRSLMPRFGTVTIPVGADGWIGVITITVAGIVWKNVEFHLVAYCKDPKTGVGSGPVFGSFDPTPLGSLLVKDRK